MPQVFQRINQDQSSDILPSSSRSSSRSSRGLLLLLCSLFATLTLLQPLPANAGTPVTLYQSFAGDMNFVTTGATFRDSGTNQCSVNGTPPNTSTATATLPAISGNLVAVYLYWAASTNTAGLAGVDSQVTFEGQTVNALRTFTETFPYGGTDYYFYSGMADVTTLVDNDADKTFTMTGLEIHTGNPHCNVSAVLGGWSMVAVYENVGVEPLRVINVWDGFQYFRDDQLILAPTNFRVPSSGLKDGKIGHLSWEGDEGNSQAGANYSEALAFSNDGFTYTSLTNPVNTPAGNQFNSTVSDLTIGQTDVWGVDVDIYDISSLIAYDSTVANTLYSSGNDLVLLTAEIFSVTNTEVADLGIDKSHTGDFTVGVNGTYTLSVSNYGPGDHTGLVSVSDSLPTGLTPLTATGSGWTCTVAAPDVDCTRSDSLNNGNSYPDITVTVSVAAGAAPSVTNTAGVTGTLFDNVAANDEDDDLTTVLIPPDLSTSVKTVVDINGGTADPGDTLRYTITLTESAGGDATVVQVTDDIPVNVSGFTVVLPLPPGATDNSVIGGGANSTGYLDIQGITVPAGTSVDIEFDVTINLGVPAGTDIDNTATVTNPNGPGATPSAPPVTVSALPPATGVKNLYLYDSPGFELSRTQPAITGNSVQLHLVNNPSATWTLAQPLAADLELDAGSFPVVLYLRRNNLNNNNTQSRTLQLDVSSSTLGLIGTITQGVSVTQTISPVTFNITPGIPLPDTLAALGTISLTVTNVTVAPVGSARAIRIFPTAGVSSHSRIELNANTVINVDSVDAYTAAYSGGVIPASFQPGDTAYVRTVISDPFGAFDIASASVQILDQASNPVGTYPLVEQVPAVTASTKTFEYAVPIPAGSGSVGTWTAIVTGVEGVEGTITHTQAGNFVVALPVPQPDILFMKISDVYDDPVNGVSPDAKAIPGAHVDYIITATNQGPGDAETVIVTDYRISTDVELYVGDLGAVGSGPILIVDGSTASGLTLPLNFIDLGSGLDEVEFDDGSDTFTHDPSTTAVGGYDAVTRAIRVRPSGVLNGAASAPYPSFEVHFRVRVK